MGKIISLTLRENVRTNICIATHFVPHLSSYIRKTHPSQVVYITDTSLLSLLRKRVSADRAHIFVLPVGERNKNFSNFQKILRFYYQRHIDKKSLVVAFGGGMVSDIAGLASSVYYRGVPVVYVPTSLLAQVDASIGGKNTINFCDSKNIIGTVYLPKVIFIDPTLLSSLPKREFASGMAEIIKCAAGFDIRLFPYLEHMGNNHRELSKLITRAIEIKIQYISSDFYEMRRKRWLLNLGHSLGHSLESQFFRMLSHGEAVSIGLLFSVYISFLRGNLQKDELDYVVSILRKYGLPPKIRFSVDKTMQQMRYDKKSHNGKIEFILLRRLGRAYICQMDFKEIQCLLEKFQPFYNSL